MSQVQDLQEPDVAGVLVHQLGQGKSKGSSSNTEDVPNRKHHARGVPKAEPTPKEHEPLRLRKGCRRTETRVSNSAR